MEVIEMLKRTLSKYTVLFTETNENWKPDALANFNFIAMVETKCNERLEAEGRLYLNDVYVMLGFPKTEAGDCVGWIYGKKYGDGYVAIDIIDFRNFKIDFVLDFNVDGHIKDII